MNDNTYFRPKTTLNVSKSARTIADLCRSNKLFFGAPYQRNDVWSHEDREKFIDAIFSEADLGSVFLIEKTFKNYQICGADFEVVDGKQRLTTITKYMNDEFSYRGFLYSELSTEDKRYFDRRLVGCSILSEEYDEDETLKIKLFLQLNDTGVRQSQEHLDSVREMLSNSRKGRQNGSGAGDATKNPAAEKDWLDKATDVLARVSKERKKL